MKQSFVGGASLLLCGALGVAASAHAADLQYQLTALGGELWRYDYTLVDVATGPAFDEFSVYFDLPDVLEIVSFTAPAGWDGLVVPVDLSLPDGGYFDALHIGGMVGTGSSLSGFSVSFRQALGATPGAQRFELALSDPFEVVASGLTSAVPEPERYALMLAGLGLMAWAVQRRPQRSAALGAMGAVATPGDRS